MNTLLKTSYLACSIAVALGTGVAHAVVPTTTPGLVVYSGGGSAEPQPIETAFCRLFNNVDNYTDAAKGAVSSDYLVLYGTAINAIGSIPAGTNVLYFYKFNGGCYPNGGIPQAGSQSAAGTAQNLTFPTTASVLSASLLTPGTQGTVCTTAQKGLPTFGYTANVNNPQLPDFGITDVEVSLFSGLNNPTTSPLVTVGSPSLVYDLVEGVAVTNSLFTGVGPSGTLPGVNKKTNFTRAEVAGILSGNITDWHNVYADNGSPVAPAGTGIILIDRNVGSGTKAGGTSYFLGFPGAGAAAVTPNSVSNLAGDGNGAGGLNGAGYSGALQKVQTSQDVLDSNSAAVVNDLTTANSAGLLAVAILSVDNPPALNQGTTGVNQFDFTKINGVAMDGGTSTDNINGTNGSSYINVINGSYDFFYQVNFNQRSGFSTGAPANNVAFANGLKAALQSPTLAGVNLNVQFPLATNGIVIDGDTVSSLATGVTVTSRGGSSPSAPKVVLKVSGSVITPGNDPL